MMWQLNLMFEGEPAEIFADDVDFSRFPLIYVTKIRKELRSGIIELPDTELYKKLVGFKVLIFPYGQLIYAGEVEEKSKPAVTVLSKLAVTPEEAKKYDLS